MKVFKCLAMISNIQGKNFERTTLILVTETLGDNFEMLMTVMVHNLWTLTYGHFALSPTSKTANYNLSFFGHEDF